MSGRIRTRSVQPSALRSAQGRAGVHRGALSLSTPDSILMCYQKAGVILTALEPAHQVQTHLFDQHDRERSQKLMAAIDTINREWGSGTIRYAAVGLRPGWLMRCARRSPRYTTRWEELAVAR